MSQWCTWYFADVGGFADAMLPPSPGLLPPSPQGLPGMQTPEAAAEDAGRRIVHCSCITLQPNSVFTRPSHRCIYMKVGEHAS